MPYIDKHARAFVDPHIALILSKLRNLDDQVQRVSMTQTQLKKIGRVVSKGEQLYHGDDDVASKLAQKIIDTFIPDVQEGVLNYVFSRIAVGAFIIYYPCPHREWPYSAIARVLKVLERSKLDLFDQGINDTVIAALDGAKMEFYCRVAVPKERAARLANGDIPEYSEPDVFP